MINILKTGIRQHFIVYVILFLCFSSSQAEPPEVPKPLRGVPLVAATASDAELSVNQIYNQAIRSVVWIGTKSVQASGVLIDRDLRFVVTNHHVVADTEKEESVVVIFPVRDKKGKLIEEQTFYTDESNLRVLLQLGYATTARVIATDAKMDLAIIELEGLPETARAIDFSAAFRFIPDRAIDFVTPFRVDGVLANPVHIIGNPEGKLWRWTAGFLDRFDKGMLRINAGTYGGNSGGPVLNAEGSLAGIVTLSNRQTETLAVPVKDVENLLATLEPRHIVSISNDLEATIPFFIKWEADGEWEEEEEIVLESGKIATAFFTGAEKLPEGYPQVIFDEIANDGEVTFCDPYSLKTHMRYFGSGFEDPAIGSGYKYYFHYDSQTEILSLRELEESNR